MNVMACSETQLTSCAYYCFIPLGPYSKVGNTAPRCALAEKMQLL